MAAMYEENIDVVNVDDLASLETLTEDFVTLTLKKRFEANRIYVST